MQIRMNVALTRWASKHCVMWLLHKGLMLGAPIRIRMMSVFEDGNTLVQNQPTVMQLCRRVMSTTKYRMHPSIEDAVPTHCTVQMTSCKFVSAETRLKIHNTRPSNSIWNKYWRLYKRWVDQCAQQCYTERITANKKLHVLPHQPGLPACAHPFFCSGCVMRQSYSGFPMTTSNMCKR